MRRAETLSIFTLARRHGRELNQRQRGSVAEHWQVALAAKLRVETAVTVKWIAERLRMGAPGYVNHLLYRRRKTEGE